MAQITSVTSDALQAKIRQLLPSQQGFGEDLQASNVILPVIDLTETASGSALRADLQTALTLDSITSFNINQTTTTLVSTTGFYRVYGACTWFNNSSDNPEADFSLTDGITTKQIWQMTVTIASNNASTNSFLYDFVVYLNAGESLTGTTDSASSGYCRLAGNTRQIADISGNLVNPAGFTAS
tara:strand:+ start:132 stop:680 length:549 start_codon:yes stop_codon:yes gene_type:complete